ncbi:MAG: Crp/Fnr family transcriptional regulator, partial [Nitrospirae bacterium]
TTDGKEVLLATLKEPEMFGEIALFDGQPRTATVVARTDCEILKLTRGEFIELIREKPATLFNLVKILIKRLREADEKIKVLSMDSATERLKWFLKKTVADCRSPEIVLPSHSEIGKILSLTREAVTRALHTLKKEGVVSNTTGKTRVNLRKL